MSGGASPLAAPEPWNLVSAAYADEVLPFFSRFAADALEHAGLLAGERVLDVACGPGTLSFQAADRGADVDAVDFSPEMVARLRRDLSGRSVRARVADGQALPFDDGLFDCAFSMFGLMFFPDRARGFAELHRILRPGGRAVVSSWVPLDRLPFMACAIGAIVGALDLPPGPPVLALAEPRTCEAEMRAAGFVDVDCFEVTHAPEALPTGESLSKLERTTAPLVLLRAHFGEDRWQAARATALATLRDRFGDGPQELAMTALFTGGVRP